MGLLFPNPPSLDCITIDDVQRRYRLTGLGAPALAAIEQSQRLVRARGDYSQTGLCEFHIGLIYFHWDDPRAAANQFALARQPWTLADDHSAACLTHFAQGLALYHAFHNEPAMLQFGRAERLLEGRGMPLLFRGAARPILRWLASLPAAELDVRPSLWVTYASALLFISQVAGVEEKLQAAEAALRNVEPDDKIRDLIGHIASIRATVAVTQHDAEAIIAQSQRALAYLHPDNLPVRTAATWALAYAHQLQGDRAAAGLAYAEALAASASA